MSACSGCIFWVGYPWKENDKPVPSVEGSCRKRAPVVVAIIEVVQAHDGRWLNQTKVADPVWPTTRHDDFCGDHKPVTPDPAALAKESRKSHDHSTREAH